jgi:hypothetical protein
LAQNEECPETKISSIVDSGQQCLKTLNKKKKKMGAFTGLGKNKRQDLFNAYFYEKNSLCELGE